MIKVGKVLYLSQMVLGHQSQNHTLGLKWIETASEIRRVIPEEPYPKWDVYDWSRKT